MASGEALPGAEVRAGSLASATGARGDYRLALAPGTYTVRIERPGYIGATVVSQEVLAEGRRLDISLPPESPSPRDGRRVVERAVELSASGRASEQALADGSDVVTGSAAGAAEIPALIRVLMSDGQIREMDTEEYLKGVVPAEMGFLWRRNQEALKAQAIAARTYAAGCCLAETAGDPAVCEPGLDAHVDTTTRTQVWRPVHYDSSDEAVEATRGEALSDGQLLIRSLYFARRRPRTLASEESTCCGGRFVRYLRSVCSPESFAENRGHGAGMSQEGAAVLASWGATAHEIVRHYYTGAEVITAAMTPSPTPTAASTAAATATATPIPGDEPGPVGSPQAPVTGEPVESARDDGAGVSGGAPVTLAGEWEIAAADLRVTRGAVELTASGAVPVSPGGVVLESPPHRAEFPFMAVGAKWSGADGADVEISIRTSHESSRWSDWLPLRPEELDEKEAPPAGVAWSTLLVARGQYLQTRVEMPFAEGGAQPLLRDVSVYYINSDEGPAAPELYDRSGGLRVIPRQDWGANEALRFDNGGQEIWPTEYIIPLAQIVHHTVTPNSPVDPAAVVRSIYYYHAVTRGWGDIGYNFLVDHLGNVYEGRYGQESDGRIVAGGHAREFNSVTIGVAALGTFTESTLLPSTAARDSLVELLARNGARFQLQPSEPVTLLGKRYPSRILGHRDVGQTVCPGDGLYGLLGSLRAAVSGRIAELPPGGPAPSATRTLVVEPKPTSTIKATPRPSAPPSPTTAAPRPSPTSQGMECPNLVVGGDFESETLLWRRSRAYYTRWDAYRGEASMFVGLRDDDPDRVLSYSSVGQTIRLPSRIDTVRLEFAYRAYGEVVDRRLVRLYDGEGRLIGLDDVFLAPTGGWRTFAVDLTSELGDRPGEEVQVYFGVVNNGNGVRSFIRLDDVALRVCPAYDAKTPATAMPTGSVATSTVIPSRATPTVQAGPSPTSDVTSRPPGEDEMVCEDLLTDGGFELEGLPGWELSGNHPAEQLDAPIHSGRRALRLGIVEPGQDGFGFSAASQEVRLPPGTVTASLALWLMPLRHSVGDAVVVEIRDPLSGARSVLVGPQPEVQSGRWVRREIALDDWPLRGIAEVYVAVLNRGQAEGSGDVASVAIDDFSLRVCHRPTTYAYLPLNYRPAP